VETLSHEHLGLFDTPPKRRESAFALAIVIVLFASYLAVLPVAKIRLGDSIGGEEDNRDRILRYESHFETSIIHRIKGPRRNSKRRKR